MGSIPWCCAGARERRVGQRSGDDDHQRGRVASGGPVLGAGERQAPAHSYGTLRTRAEGVSGRRAHGHEVLTSALRAHGDQAPGEAVGRCRVPQARPHRPGVSQPVPAHRPRGVVLGRGVESGKADEEDDVNLMDRAQYEARWAQWSSLPGLPGETVRVVGPGESS